MNRRHVRLGAGISLVVVLIAAAVLVVQHSDARSRVDVVAYFDNTNGVYVGDNVNILGVPVGKISKIEPLPDGAKVSFWYESKYRVPVEVKAVILSPSLVTARAIQLTPAYSAGPALYSGAVIPRARTAVPMEFDDFRRQLEKLTDTLQPTQPGGVSTLGGFINTAADNLRGQGANIRDTLIKLSQAYSALGDHSGDLFGTVRNLATLVSALQSSADLTRQLNENLAAVTGQLSDRPDEVGQALADLGDVAGDVRTFVADNKEALGTTTDNVEAVTQIVAQRLDDVKQLLHLAPTAVQNLANIYQPSQATLTGALALTNFSNPISFICGAIQAASRLGAEQAAKLCVQYLAPIVKNRQYNFPPLGFNPFVGQTARPNELTYSEDWLRPDYVPPQRQTPSADLNAAPLPAESAGVANGVPAVPASSAPAGDLAGLMMPAGAGS